MKNRILGLSLSIMLPPLGETAVPFPWRPVPEHLANLLGIGELLSVGDPPQSQMGQLPQPLGQTNLRMAQWFDLCSTTELFFIETVEIMETITPTLCMWDMHALMHQVWNCQIEEATMLQDLEWDPHQHGSTTPRVSLPPSDKRMTAPLTHPMAISGYGWGQSVTPIKGVMMQQCILQLFSEHGHCGSLVNMSELPTPSSDELCNSI